MPADSRIQVLAPVIHRKKGNHKKALVDIGKQGFARVRVDGAVRDLDEEIELDRYVIHDIEIVVDRLIIRRFEAERHEDAKAFETRLTDAVETALELGDGRIIIQDVTERDNSVDHLFSEDLACPEWPRQRAGTGAAPVQLQYAEWRMHDLSGFGVQPGDRSGTNRAGPGQVYSGRGDKREWLWAGRQEGLELECLPEHGARVRLPA